MVVHIDDKWTDYKRVFFPNYYIFTCVFWVIGIILLVIFLNWPSDLFSIFIIVLLWSLPLIGILYFLSWVVKNSQKNPWKYVDIHIDNIIPQIDELLDVNSVKNDRYTSLEYAEKTGDLDAIKSILQDRDSYKSYIYELNDGAETIVVTEITNSDNDMTRIVIMPYESEHIKVLDIVKNGIDGFSL